MEHFGVLEIRSLRDVASPMFPVFGDDFRLVLEENEQVSQICGISRIRLYDLEDGQLQVRSTWSVGAADLLVSNQRIVVSSRDFDGAKFDVGEVVGDSLFGIASGLTSLAVEAASAVGGAAKKKRRKSIYCGHLFYSWIEGISFRPRLSRKEPGYIRFSFLRHRNGAVATSYLELTLAKQDAFELASDLCRRIAQWYFDNRSPTPTGELSYLSNVLTTPLTMPVGRATSARDISRYAFADELHTPVALRAAAEYLDGKSEMAILLARGRDSRPPILGFDLPAEGNGLATGMSVLIDSQGEISPVSGEEAHFSASARGYVSWYVDPKSCLPDTRQLTASSLLKGEIRLLCTTNRFAVLLTEGEVPGGVIRQEARTGMVAVFPLDKIAYVGAMVGSVRNDDGSVRYVLLVGCDDDTWGEIRIGAIHEGKVMTGHEMSQLEGTSDLVAMAAVLAGAIAHARRVPAPRGERADNGDVEFRLPRGVQ